MTRPSGVRRVAFRPGAGNAAVEADRIISVYPSRRPKWILAEGLPGPPQRCVVRDAPVVRPRLGSAAGDGRLSPTALQLLRANHTGGIRESVLVATVAVGRLVVALQLLERPADLLAEGGGSPTRPAPAGRRRSWSCWAWPRTPRSRPGPDGRRGG